MNETKWNYILQTYWIMLTICLTFIDARDVLHVCTRRKDKNGTSTGDIFFFRWVFFSVLSNVPSILC